MSSESKSGNVRRAERKRAAEPPVQRERGAGGMSLPLCYDGYN